MTTRPRFKGQPSRPQSVGVIASAEELRAVARLRAPPDLFELRLDHLWRDLAEVEMRLPQLRSQANIIITARDPREGGSNRLSAPQRRELLIRFLPYADMIDVELRSARSFTPIIEQAGGRGVVRILSLHDFKSTPPARNLRSKVLAAEKYGADIFKVATRTDSKSDIERLVEFLSTYRTTIRISAMGMGKFGPESRRRLLQAGSILNYGSVQSSRVAGQPSVSEIRRWMFRGRRAKAAPSRIGR